MSSTALLRLNTDCLGIVLRYLDSEALLALRATSAATRRLISECPVYIYAGKGCTWRQLESLSEYLQDSRFVIDPGNTRSFIFQRGTSEPHTSLFLRQFEYFCDKDALRNIQILRMISPTFTDYIADLGVFAALRRAAQKGALSQLTQCVVKLTEEHSPDMRSVMCVHCPKLRLLDLKECCMTMHADTSLNGVMMDRYISEHDVWPALEAINAGWILDQLLDGLDFEEVPRVAGNVVNRLNRSNFLKVSTLQLHMNSPEALLDAIRAIVLAKDTFFGDQIQCIDISGGYEDSMDGMFSSHQLWVDYASELAIASGSSDRLGMRKLPVVFPNLKLLRTHLLPSPYVFELISPLTSIDFQASIGDGPIVSHFFRNRYRPGLLSPTIRGLFLQDMPLYSHHEQQHLSLLMEESSLAQHRGGVIDKQGYIEAMKNGMFIGLEELRIDCSAALAPAEDDDSGELFCVIKCRELQHLTISFRDHLTIKLLESYLDNVVDLLRSVCIHERLPHLNTLDLLINQEHLWSYASYSIISQIEESMPDTFRIHGAKGSNAKISGESSLRVRLIGHHYATLLSK